MFCNQCGQTNSNDAKFCSSCGNKLEIKNIQPAQTHQQPIKTESPQPRKKQIELWNPNAAANWSLLFTPIFGSFLQMKNWQALGNSNEASNARNWLIFTIVFILFINFLSYLADANLEQSTTVARGLGFWYIIIWYFAYARKQTKYVKETLNNRYQKKSWWIPLVSATVILFVTTFIFIAVGSSLVQRKNPTQDNQLQQTTNQQNPFAQFVKPQEKKEENPFAQFVQQNPQNHDVKPREMDLNNGTTTPPQQERQNNNLGTTSSYSNNYHSYDDSNSNKYVYRTRSTEDTSSLTSNDYYQNTDSYSSSKTRYDDYTTIKNSTPMTTPAPAPQSTHMTSCDGSGCWDNQGNRYAGNNGTYFQQNGGVCRDIGGMVQCN